jgi:hypothetical protein
MTKQQTNFLALGLIALLAIVCVVALQLTKLADKNPTNGDPDEAPHMGQAADNFAFIQPTDWKFTKNAAVDIQSLAPGQEINTGIVQSLNDEGIYYFATSAGNPNETPETLQSIYKYDAPTYTFERIYRLTTDTSENFPGIRPGANLRLHALGHDGYNLIVLARDADISPGPCAELYTFGRDSDDLNGEMLSINLLDPFAKGLEPYRVPDDVYQAALKRQSACAEAF